MKTNILTKLSFFLLLLTLGTVNGWAKQQTFYWSAKVASNPTGAGQVYISGTKADCSDKKTSDSGSLSAYQTPSFTVYLKAIPGNEYTLRDWTGSNGTTYYGETTNVSITGKTGSATQITYTANFVKKGCLVVESDEGGAATVDVINNTAGQTVHLEAFGSFDYVFAGWEVNGKIESRDRQLTVKIPDTATALNPVKYKATWTKNTVTYYRIKNGNGQYLSMVGTQGSALTSGTGDGQTFDGIELKGTLKLVNNNVQSDPSTIFKVTTTGYNSGVYSDFEMESQGLKLTDILKADIAQISRVTLTEKLVLNWDGRNGYKIKNLDQGFFIQHKGSDAHASFIAEDYSGAQNDIWYFEPVDGSTSTANLAVTSEKTIGDKHYATLFVPFPFQCADGMKAYYVADIVDDRAECNTNGIVNVHGFTPVILEWTDGSNYVVPINTEKDQPGNVVSNAIEQGWWKGCINLYTTGGNNPSLHTCYFDRDGKMTDANQLVQFDSSTMRVMDVDGDNLVLNTNFTQGPNMPSNKCFIEKNPVRDLYVVIFPLELDEASPELSEPHNAIYAEVHVLRSVAGPKDGEEWGNWNTLCLPFDLDATEIESLFGECELKALDHFWVTDDGTLHLRFEDATTIACGQPYMIRVKKDIADITLHNKWVNTEKLNNQHFVTDDYTLDFQGSYVWLDGTSGNYVPRNAFIISNNLFYLVNSNVKMKGFRAYFMPEAKPAAKAPIRVMKFATEDKPTAIGTVSFDGLDDGPIYNTQGVRLNSMQRGINIVNGKKIIR